MFNCFHIRNIEFARLAMAQRSIMSMFAKASTKLAPKPPAKCAGVPEVKLSREYDKWTKQLFMSCVSTNTEIPAREDGKSWTLLLFVKRQASLRSLPSKGECAKRNTDN